MILDLLVDSLVLKLNLVGKNIAGGGSPVCGPGVNTGDPFASDIGVDLHAVRVSVVGGDRHGEV